MKKIKLIEDDKLELQEMGFPKDCENVAFRMIFEKGEMIYSEGCIIENLLIIKRGKGKVSITVPQGKNLLVSFYGENTTMGIVELLLDSIGTTNVQTIEETECIAIPYTYCKEVMNTSTKLLKYINRLLANIVTKTSNNAAINQLSSLEARLCAYIELTCEKNIFNTNLTHLAEILGTSYRHLLRTLNMLCKKKILKKEAFGYVIIDLKQLKKNGEENYIFI